jgi:hypothetical protein
MALKGAWALAHIDNEAKRHAGLNGGYVTVANSHNELALKDKKKDKKCVLRLAYAQ